jgi:hypothetical protein
MGPFPPTRGSTTPGAMVTPPASPALHISDHFVSRREGRHHIVGGSGARAGAPGRTGGRGGGHARAGGRGGFVRLELGGEPHRYHKYPYSHGYCRKMRWMRQFRTLSADRKEAARAAPPEYEARATTQWGVIGTEVREEIRQYVEGSRVDGDKRDGLRVLARQLATWVRCSEVRPASGPYTTIGRTSGSRKRTCPRRWRW